MLRLIFVIGSSVLVLFSYQNCAKNGFINKSSDSSPSGIGTSSGVVAPSGSVIVNKAVNLSLSENFVIAANSVQAGSNAGVVSHTIDLVSGEISEQRLGGISTGKLYCLVPTELQELKDIIFSSTVCKPTNNPPADSVCAQVIVEPYGTLILHDKSEITLGLQSDPCTPGFDLCGEKKTMLRGFITFLHSNLSTHLCK